MRNSSLSCSEGTTIPQGGTEVLRAAEGEEGVEGSLGARSPGDRRHPKSMERRP
jgi:hypothetical protein